MYKNVVRQMDDLINLVELSPDIQVITVDEDLDFESSFSGLEDYWETNVILSNLEKFYGRLKPGYYLYHRPTNRTGYLSDNPLTTARYLVEGYLGSYR